MLSIGKGRWTILPCSSGSYYFEMMRKGIPSGATVDASSKGASSWVLIVGLVAFLWHSHSIIAIKRTCSIFPHLIQIFPFWGKQGQQHLQQKKR